MKEFSAFLKKHASAIGLLLGATLITYLLVFDPALYMDDWHFMEKYIFHHLPYVDFSSRRPLENIGFRLLLDIFGLNLRALFVVQALTHFLCALSVYFVTRRAFPKTLHLAFPVALISLVYPVDYTRMWLTQVYTWFIFLFTVVAIYLLIDFAERGKIWLLAAALVLIVIPLGAYEAQFGLIAAGCVLIAGLHKNVPLKRRLAILSPLLVGVIFVLWRFYIQPKMLNVIDPYLSGLSIDPFPIAHRLFSAFGVFVFGWIKPFTFLFPEISNLKIYFILLCFIGFSAAVVLLQHSQGLPESLSPEEKKTSLTNLSAIAGIGFVLLVAGYLPIVFYGEPNLRFTGPTTRLNLFAIYGGSLLLVALVGFGAALLSKYRGQIIPVVYSTILVLFVAGAFQQIWNQNEARLSWRAQQFFWRNLFVFVPDLKDGTTLVVVEKGAFPEVPFRRLPLIAEWEVDDGVRILYNNQSLRGTVFLADINTGAQSQTRLAPDGVHGYDLKFVPYNEVVIVQFTPGSTMLRIIKDPEQELHLPFSPRDYKPERLILVFPPESTPYRQLIMKRR